MTEDSQREPLHERQEKTLMGTSFKALAGTGTTVMTGFH